MLRILFVNKKYAIPGYIIIDKTTCHNLHFIYFIDDHTVDGIKFLIIFDEQHDLWIITSHSQYNVLALQL